MYKSIKLKNDTFWDTVSGVHRRTNLQTVIDNILAKNTSQDTSITNLTNNKQDKITNLANKIIDSTGSNSNGNYIKFTDGTMICHGYKSGLSYTPTDMWSWCDRTSPLTVIFAEVFKDVPSVVINSTTFEVVTVNLSGITSNNFTFYGFQPKNCGRKSVGISYTAIGKWK